MDEPCTGRYDALEILPKSVSLNQKQMQHKNSNESRDISQEYIKKSSPNRLTMGNHELLSVSATPTKRMNNQSFSSYDDRSGPKGQVDGTSNGHRLFKSAILLGGTLPDPPDSFKIAHNPIKPTDTSRNFQVTKLVKAVGYPLGTRPVKTCYFHVREMYLSKLRREQLSPKIEHRVQLIENQFFDGTIDDLVDLYRKRQRWRCTIESLQNKRKICAADGCINFCLDGSEFCSVHVLRDPNQSLFHECPDCHQPFPVLSSCYRCNGFA